MTTHRTIALIVAAGQGTRLGGPPKQFAMLCGKPMIAHSYAALSAHEAIDDVVVVIGAGQNGMLATAIGPVRNVTGGATRRESVQAGLASLADDAPTRVLVHDAARPFLSAAVIDRLLAALDTHDGAVPVLPVADTLAHGDTTLGEIVARDGLYRIDRKSTRLN